MAAGSSTGGNGLSIEAGTVGRGAAVGALAFVAGWVLAGLLAPDGGNPRGIVNVSIPAWKGAGWYFYSAHVVDLVISTEAGGVSGTGTQNLIGNADDATVQLLYLAPPLLLGTGGAVLARTLGAAAEPEEGAKAGALVVAGYLPLACIGALLTEHTETTSVLGAEISATWTVELVPAVLLAGLLYPLLFGALGGVAASALEGR